MIYITRSKALGSKDQRSLSPWIHHHCPELPLNGALLTLFTRQWWWDQDSSYNKIAAFEKKEKK